MQHHCAVLLFDNLPSRIGAHGVGVRLSGVPTIFLLIIMAKLQLVTNLVEDKASRMHAVDLRLHRDIHNVRIEIESDRSQSLLGRYLIT